MTEAITQKYLREAFTYIDGELYWNERPISHFENAWFMRVFNSRQAGKLAGHKSKDGYTKIKVQEKIYRMHRLVFTYHFGYEPTVIDHIDGNQRNNRIENLRECTTRQNSWNLKKKHGSVCKSGHRNVYVKAGKYQVSIGKDTKTYYFGTFERLEDAVDMAKQMRQTLYGEFA